MQRLILFFLFLIPSFLMAQVVDIPDPNFLAALIEEGVDINGDGMIQVSEAEVVIELDVGKKEIDDIKGIEAFIYLEELYCDENNLTNLNISKNVELRILKCFRNELSELVVSQNLALEELGCGSNNLSELDVSQNLVLKELSCYSNNLIELDVSQNLALATLGCGLNFLIELDLSKNLALSSLSCRANNLSVLDLKENRNVYYLDCSYISTLHSLDLSQNVLLSQFYCEGCNFEYLDLSNSNLRSYIYLEYSSIPYINLSNGRITSQCYADFIIDNIGLKYLCLDEAEVDIITECVSDHTSINTYCNFSLNDGANCLRGKNQYDLNGSCDNSSITVTQVPFEIRDSTKSYKWWPAYDNEEYKMFFPSGPHVVKHCIDTSLFVSTPDSIELDFLGVEDTVYQDFCVGPNGIEVTDLAISLIPLDVARAGFESDYKLIIENLGNLYSSGTVVLDIPMDTVQMLSSSEAYIVNGNQVTWTYTDLPILSRKTITFRTRTNSPMDIPAINGGEILKFKAEVFPAMTDSNPIDNTSSLCQTVVNSYDPNDKRCLQGGLLDETRVGSYLDYMIRFENTGSAEAINITVQDTLDTEVYDISTFRLLDASHSVHVSQKGNAIEFIFNDIYLSHVDSLNDGYVAFKIKTLDNLEIGDSITNDAAIYFDFNWPIITDEAVTIVGNDQDGDGYTIFEDCDDTDPMVNPGQIEIAYNGIDDDCDPLTLDDDLDGDGYDLIDDCNDNDFSINPDASELCDGLDNNCNDQIDEGLDLVTYYIDLDQDGYGDDATAKEECSQPDGWITLGGDCDDTNPSINPDQIEITYNGIDDDCDPLTLDDDLDGDGYVIADDCDDNNSLINPGAEEICDGLDNNCNEAIDEGLDFLTYYIDQDQDGYGDDDTAREECSQPDSLITTGGDCNDTDPSINPGAEDIVNNGIDEDCDGMDAVSSVNDLAEIGVTIYPNPVKDLLYIQQEQTDQLNVSLFNVEGKRVLHRHLSQPLNTLDVSTLTSGVYFLRIMRMDRVVNERVVVE